MTISYRSFLILDMTSPEQIQTLNKFQSGDCQLLIATSVAEQGLDIPQCNLVICYEYVTDATGRVQTRGELIVLEVH